MAKIYASECATFVAKHALQVHGAIGYTIECDLHFFMKRAWALAAAYGDTHAHRRNIANVLLGPVAEAQGG
jgi:alkylation response protein AidB-like acyl-CoA dehydrogenase